jgi:C1A family cysteine protease
MGWQRDLPDPRDYTPDHKDVLALLRRLRRRKRKRLPAAVDLRADGDGVYFSPPDDQGPVNCSPVFACLGLVEYFERRASGKVFEPSKLFLYQMVRRLRRALVEPGVDLRTTFKTLVRYGVPPADLWPYAPEKYDVEPRDLTLLGFRREFESLRYVRLDARNTRGPDVLDLLRSFLAARFPVAFGFSVPQSLGREAVIPYRPTFDTIRGGHAVVAVGYDDRRAVSTKGALLVRNSWGETWGDGGYGWLPYVYIRQQLAVDFWTLLREDWLCSGEFLEPTGGRARS